jgi:hypothetical protein
VQNDVCFCGISGLSTVDDPSSDGNPVFFILKGREKTVGALRREIYTATGIQTSHQSITTNSGRITSDTDDILVFHSLELPARVVMLFILSVEQMSTIPLSYEITVRLLSGRSLMLGVRGSDTISSVKGQIQEKEGIPLDMQRLVFGKKELEGGTILANGNIKKVRLVISSCKVSSNWNDSGKRLVFV